MHPEIGIRRLVARRRARLRAVRLARRGSVVVTDVDPRSAAAQRGFKEGDVILEVGGKSVANVGDVRDAIKSARADKKGAVLMRIRTGDASRYVAVPLDNNG